MSEYNMSHTGAQLDEAIDKVKNGYILPEESINISANGEYDVTEFAKAVVSVPVPDGYVNFTNFYSNEYTQTSSTLELSHTFTCGFKPKVVLITLNTDTTLGTTNSLMFAMRINIDGIDSVGKGLYKLATTNRTGAFGGGLSISNFTSTGFTYSHSTIGFAKDITYNIYAWG